jgi:hypothetical protein
VSAHLPILEAMVPAITQAVHDGMLGNADAARGHLDVAADNAMALVRLSIEQDNLALGLAAKRVIDLSVLLAAWLDTLETAATLLTPASTSLPPAGVQ